MKSIEVRNLPGLKNKTYETDKINELKTICAFFGISYFIEDLEMCELNEHIKTIGERLKKVHRDGI